MVIVRKVGTPWFRPSCYYLNDHLGSTRALVDSTGLVVAKYDYYPYGGLRASWVSTDTKVRFTGKYYDGEDVSQYYFGARYLNGLTNRFNSIDPAAGKYPGWSPYVYAAANPVRIKDNGGLSNADFHYDLMYHASVVITGASAEVATAIASADNGVDLGTKNALLSQNKGPLSQHFQSMASGMILDMLENPAGLSPTVFGTLMHTSNDVPFAHAGYEPKWGHWWASATGHDPDPVGEHSDRTKLKAIDIAELRDVYDKMAAWNGGKANTSWEAFLNVCEKWVKEHGSLTDIQTLVGGKTRNELEAEQMRKELESHRHNQGDAMQLRLDEIQE